MAEESPAEKLLKFNGGAVVAMQGKECVAIATDKRFGSGPYTIATNYTKIFQMGPYLFVGLPGFASDGMAVYRKLRFRVNLYELKENRLMAPRTLASVAANILYERKFGIFFIEPIVAGLHPKTFKPYICQMDFLGCLNEPDDFVVSGTCCQQLYGMCEALWVPDLGPDALFETISQALVNSADRDPLSGFGAVIYVIEKDKVTERHVKTRMD